jgi:hypothetical protein
VTRLPDLQIICHAAHAAVVPLVISGCLLHDETVCMCLTCYGVCSQSVRGSRHLSVCLSSVRACSSLLRARLCLLPVTGKVAACPCLLCGGMCTGDVVVTLHVICHAAQAAVLPLVICSGACSVVQAVCTCLICCSWCLCDGTVSIVPQHETTSMCRHLEYMSTCMLTGIPCVCEVTIIPVMQRMLQSCLETVAACTCLLCGSLCAGDLATTPTCDLSCSACSSLAFGDHSVPVVISGCVLRGANCLHKFVMLFMLSAS